MQKKYFYNLITSILISSFILTPFFIVSRAKAQVVSGYANGLGVAILKLPQCGNILGSGVNTLFNGIGDLFSGSSINMPDDFREQIEKANESIKDGTGNLTERVTEEGNRFDSIQTSNPTLERDIKELKKDTKLVKESTESLNANSTCIQSIGRLIIKMLLQKLTVSTVEWINSGFDGSPSFIQNPDKFFSDIAKTEFLQFGGEVMGANEKFGKDWLRNMALSYDQKFQDNARYSLEEVQRQKDPTFTAERFQQDFSMGGWDAWTSLTQTPANNPIGFKLMADNEIQRRLAGTVQSTAENAREMLAQANGFLGDQRCIEPKGVTQTEDRNARAGDKNARKCIGGFEYVTPGKMISDAATNVIGYQNNAYLNVEDLNDAVAAMIDALLGQFSNNIIEKGFANINDEGSSGNLVLTEYQKTDTRTRTQRDYSSALLSSSWLQANPNFNIRTDLTQALIDEQRTYSDKLAEQNKELLSTTDEKPYNIDISTGISNAYGLIPVINQLDYCIPGPHPGWEEDSRNILAAATDKILPETQDSLKDKDLSAVTGMAKSIIPMAAGAVAGGLVMGATGGVVLGIAIGTTMLPIVGTIVGAVVGTVVSFVIDIFSGDDNPEVRTYYAYILGAFMGYVPPANNENDDRALNLESKTGAVGVLNTVLDRYTIMINQIYTLDILPSVAAENVVNYNQLKGYYQMMKNNGDKISSLKTTINILGEIKSKVDELNRRYKINNEINENDYENELQAQINAFGRISADMINGADIASADKILKQIKDKRIYIYNNLLKGPYGCEKELETPKNFPFPYKITDNKGSALGNYSTIFENARWDKNNTASVKRMTYPSAIIYDYNKIIKNGNIPDGANTPKLKPWWNSGYINKMPNAGTGFYDSSGDLIMGPGFLSFIYFSAGSGASWNADAYRGPERLKIHDLVPQGGGFQYMSLGLRKTGSEGSSPWETMIGIY